MALAYVALSVTPTGPDPRRDRIRELSATIVEPDGSRSRVHHVVGTDRAWVDTARSLKELWRDRRVVMHDPGRVTMVMAAEGVRLPEPPIDTAELAAILVPGLAATDLPSLAAFLGVASRPDDLDHNDADLLADVMERLLARIAEYDDVTLDRLSLHIEDGGWPFADLFRPTPRKGRGKGKAARRLPPPEVSFLRERPREDPLEPTGSLEPIGKDEVTAIIGPEGALSQVIAGFERRSQQEAMAAAVTEAINTSGQLLVEAGTGTGKSLAYLVPAALAAAERGEPIVLSTNTLALQDQLIRKDVPDLQAALGTDDGEPLAVVAVKGRANYLCLRRWFPWERESSLESDEARLKAKILAWLPRTETGDRSELRLTGGEELHWRKIAEEEGSCDPGACVFHQRGQCFLFRARRAAEGAHLVVVNHALLLTDAASSNRILPDYEALVIDEAHHLEDQATSQFTVSLSENQLDEVADAIARRDGPAMTGVVAGAIAFLLGAASDDAGQRRARAARDRLGDAEKAAEGMRAAGRDLFAALEYVQLDSEAGASAADRARRVTAATRGSPAWQAVDAAWDRLLTIFRETEATLRWFATEVDAVDDLAAADLAEAGERQELLLGDLATTLRATTDLAAKFAQAFDSPDASRVFWLDRRGPLDRIVFRSAPLDVSELLQERLFKRTRATVLTSATMAVDGSCDYIANRLGIPDASSLIVPSPFDYRAAVLLHLADDMPDPTHPGYHAALEETLIETLAATRGRGLVLFTSHATLSDVARTITAPLLERGVTVLAQRRDGSPQQLVERLRREENVAVLGTASFWEGVDVAGEALSLLVIARLPFNVPTDPVFAARSEAFEDAFAGYAVPQAVLRFKQGFGRLIRTSQDRGVCAVLDRRILTKRYGATFLQSLPDCTVEVGSRLDLPLAAKMWLHPGAESPRHEQQVLIPAQM
ncbi:MAG: helicase C-terminal domain-containing protein [Thermomicrobiales bacterium]